MELRNAGGTQGGTGMFLVGLGMFCVGLYLLFQQIDVHGGYWRWGGGNDQTFGLTLVPLLAGVGVLFWNGSSKVGWLLAGIGLLILVAGIIVNMQIHWRRTSLFNALVMLVLVAGGIGMMARALRPVATGDGGGGTNRGDRDEE
ncbi:MAG TPA: hypothetical protein VM261_09220 [Kofleriaceae bacterium]|nr:hypothetical protein [Kofleriaceae bacterium]